jgi:hypothetical protein
MASSDHGLLISLGTPFRYRRALCVGRRDSRRWGDQTGPLMRWSLCAWPTANRSVSIRSDEEIDAARHAQAARRIPGSTHFFVVSSAPSPLAPGADPPRNSFFPLGSVMFRPTALFDRSLA